MGSNTTQTSFTPGPWEFAGETTEDMSSGICDVPFIHIAADGYEEGGGICMVHDKRNGVGLANARLIAASPDLLVYAKASELSRQRDECHRLGIDRSGIDSRLRALGWPKDTDLGFWIRDLCFAALFKAEGGVA